MCAIEKLKLLFKRVLYNSRAANGKFPSSLLSRPQTRSSISIVFFKCHSDFVSFKWPVLDCQTAPFVHTSWRAWLSAWYPTNCALCLYLFVYSQRLCSPNTITLRNEEGVLLLRLRKLNCRVFIVQSKYLWKERSGLDTRWEVLVLESSPVFDFNLSNSGRSEAISIYRWEVLVLVSPGQ